MSAAEYSQMVQPPPEPRVSESKPYDEDVIDPSWNVDDEEEESDEEDEPPRRGRDRKSKGKEKVQPKAKAKPRGKRKALQGKSFHLTPFSR
jgi:hypothetical protein